LTSKRTESREKTSQRTCDKGIAHLDLIQEILFYLPALFQAREIYRGFIIRHKPTWGFNVIKGQCTSNSKIDFGTYRRDICCVLHMFIIVKRLKFNLAMVFFIMI
jgi:hypothetical protein